MATKRRRVWANWYPALGDALRVAGAHYEVDADVMTARRELRAVLLQTATTLGVML